MPGIPLINIWYDVVEGSAMAGDGVRPIGVSRCETSRGLYIVGLYTKHIRSISMDTMYVVWSSFYNPANTSVDLPDKDLVYFV